MSTPSTIKDLLAAGDVSKGDVKKIAAALWEQDEVASTAFPAPYSVALPPFDELPEHVQGFIIKGILEAAVIPTLRQKTTSKRRSKRRTDDDIEPPTVDNEVI